MSNSRSKDRRPMASRTDRRRAAVERRRAHTRGGITALVAARRRRARVRWASAAAAVVVIGAGVVVFVATRDDGGIPKLELTGDRVKDADGALGITAPLTASTVDYELQTFSAADPETPVPGTETIRVSRPFDAEVTATSGEGDSVSTNSLLSVFGKGSGAQNGADPTVSVRAPAGGLGDFRLDASLDDLVASGQFQLKERRTVAGRDCQVYRTGSPLEALAVTAPTDTNYADMCIDASGLLLEEVVYANGLPSQHLKATDVNEDAVDDIAIDGEPADATTTLAEIDATTPPVEGYWSLSKVPDGYTLKGRYAYTEPGQADAPAPADDPTASTTVAPTPPPVVSYADVYTSGQDFLIVRQGPATQEPTPAGATSDATIDPLGAVTENSGYDGSTIVAHPAAPTDWFLTINASVDMEALTTIAGTLGQAAP